jgi:hypothetical protein
MRKNNKSSKKLNLNTQTVRELDSERLSLSAGGISIHPATYFSCSLCASCHQ